MDWHPHAETYPLLEGDDYEQFSAAAEASDVREPIRYRMHQGKEQGLDGRNRERYAKEHKINWPKEKVNVPDSKVEQYIDSLNLHRRHLTKEQRKDRILRLRADGHSTREIASILGVGKSTVAREIDISGVPNGTPGKGSGSKNSTIPKPEKVTGKDGKQYQAKKQKKEREPGDDTEEEPDLKHLPKSVKNALSDTWHAESARILSKIRKECKSAFSWSSWLDASVLDYLKSAEDCFLAAIPRRICPDCNGEKTVGGKSCQTCRQGGYLASQVTE